jgi:anthranilate synthase component 2
MLLLLDNHDSFTYNLAQYLGELGAAVRVVVSDRVTVSEIAAMRPSHVVISPGPGTPDQAGISVELVEGLRGSVPILGVCLGHQAIGQAFGGRVVRATQVMHGKVSSVFHDGQGLFRALPAGFPATRYHSLVLDPGTLPDCLRVTATTDPRGPGAAPEGEIMGVRHRALPIYGVQFHPESIFTPAGKALLGNFLGGDA